MGKSKIIKHYNTETIVCPYCGYSLIYDGSEDLDGDEQKCHKCKNIYGINVDYIAYYTTYKINKCNNE